MAERSEWSDFYVIVGSATGALIGSQFVIMTLIANRTDYVPPEARAACATPRAVHFAVVLLLSAVASAPRHDKNALPICWEAICKSEAGKAWRPEQLVHNLPAQDRDSER